MIVYVRATPGVKRSVPVSLSSLTPFAPGRKRIRRHSIGPTPPFSRNVAEYAFPTLPLFSFFVTNASFGATVIRKSCIATRPSVSFRVIFTGKDPATVGEPLMAPVFTSNTSPVGSPAISRVYASFPPAAVARSVYWRPTSVRGAGGTVSSSLSRTGRLYVTWFERDPSVTFTISFVSPLFVVGVPETTPVDETPMPVGACTADHDCVPPPEAVSWIGPYAWPTVAGGTFACVCSIFSPRAMRIVMSRSAVRRVFGGVSSMAQSALPSLHIWSPTGKSPATSGTPSIRQSVEVPTRRRPGGKDVPPTTRNS
jgi:hypothetical protein